MMGNEKRDLLLFTTNFPCGSDEITFLPQELVHLAERFNKIYIFPFKPSNESNIRLQDNVQVVLPSEYATPIARGLGDYLIVLKIFLFELIMSGNFKLLKNFRYHFSELFLYLAKARQVSRFLKEKKIKNNQVIFYTYWFDDWAAIIAILKRFFLNEIIFISRAHGYDLYEYRSQWGYIFPRQIQFAEVNEVHAISENGRDYLKNAFSKHRNKIYTTRLGVPQHQEMALAIKSTEEFLLVSCSSIIALKRVKLIIEILSHVKRKIRWIHFGDGNLAEETRQLANTLPKNVMVEFRGYVMNNEIKKFYNENFVDLFINVSSVEGIPVSMMEAISFGVPIIGTNVGGVKELVNPTTGILIDAQFSATDIARIIDGFSRSPQQRKEIINFWKSNYDADLNAIKFIDNILELKQSQ